MYPGEPTIMTADRFEKYSILQHHELFGQLQPNHLDRLRSCITKKILRRNSIIFSKGDHGGALYAITKGTVKISLPSMEGDEAVLSLLGEGRIFGEIALLDGGPRTADAICDTDCELYVIERRDFLTLMRSDPEIALKLIEILCARLRKMTDQAHDIMFLSLPKRLANTLLRLSEAGSSPEERQVRATQSALASVIGVSREATNKQLRAWEKNKWLRTERRGVIVFSLKHISKISD
jgi:CRP/FNR family cyclic AMP-dependent transcriptional regulator